MLFDHLSTSWSLLHHGWSMFKSINRRTIIKSTLIINNLSVIESLIKLGLLLYSSRLKPVNLMVNLLKWALYRLMSILYELRMWVLHPGTSWLNLHHSFMSLRGLGWLLLNYLRWWTLIIYILILIVMKIWILNHMLWLRLSMHYWLCLWEHWNILFVSRRCMNRLTDSVLRLLWENRNGLLLHRLLLNMNWLLLYMNRLLLNMNWLLLNMNRLLLNMNRLMDYFSWWLLVTSRYWCLMINNFWLLLLMVYRL